MNPDPNPSGQKDQRDALAESEKEASRQQPRSYDERNTTEKEVKINPTEPDSDAAIRGIDPKQ